MLVLPRARRRTLCARCRKHIIPKHLPNHGAIAMGGSISPLIDNALKCQKQTSENKYSAFTGGHHASRVLRSCSPIPQPEGGDR